jgi:hypothetical protein
MRRTLPDSRSPCQCVYFGGTMRNDRLFELIGSKDEKRGLLTLRCQCIFQHHGRIQRTLPWLLLLLTASGAARSRVEHSWTVQMGSICNVGLSRPCREYANGPKHWTPPTTLVEPYSIICEAWNLCPHLTCEIGTRRCTIDIATFESLFTRTLMLCARYHYAQRHFGASGILDC